MPENTTTLIDAILAELPGSGTSELKRFTGAFYAKMLAPDLRAMSVGQAATLANSAFDFIKIRKASEPVIRIAKSGALGTRLSIDIANDDMPFLVDSVTAELTRQGYTLHTVLHPIVNVTRDTKGKMTAIGESGIHESIMHLDVSVPNEGADEEKLRESLEQVLLAVRLAVTDWPQIITQVEKAEQTLATLSGFPAADMAELRDFMHWLSAKNFIFLGYVEYDFYDAKGEQQLSIVEGSELGIFKLDDPELKPLGLVGLPPEVLHFALRPQLIEISKSVRKSAVHRPVQMDYIGLKRFDSAGKVVGEIRFLGLFTSSVYYQSAEQIPLIRRKIARTLAKAGFASMSHDGKALKAILEFLPRDEIFQMTEDELFDCAMGILSLEARPAVRLFLRRDPFERFLSCMVFVPRERFSTYQREQIQKILEDAFHGNVTAFYTQVTDSPLARIHIIVRTTPGQIPEVDSEAVEAEITSVTALWTDALQTALIEKLPDQAEALYPAYSNAFPKSYGNQHDAGQAVHDIEKIEEAIASGQLALELFRKREDTPGFLNLKLYNPFKQVSLSDVLPMLERFGFRVVDETPYLISPHGRNDHHEIWIRDFRLTWADDSLADLAPVKAAFEDALQRVWSGEIESDGFNALVLKAGLTARQVVILRAYAKYLKQAGFPYNQTTIEQALAAHPDLATALVQLFFARFDPNKKQNKNASSPDDKTILAEIETGLSTITSLVEDRILRRFTDLIGATLRTNFFQQHKVSEPKPYLSFKFNSAIVPELPKPVPYAEIFVYARDIEGIHLRGGKVARGGLRWSDRTEDFRTEVLGLMKAQMVKNSVIVPVGSKGGFVLKNAAGLARDAFQEEGIRCYKIFLRGLLDLTDNIVAGKIVPPENVVRHDDDDPYLVVAADKGTATFSDIANSVSAEYGFWLGDAFASGGSVGYDHKKMAITAKGAWISVTRHFAEAGIDIGTTDFTCCGIGDMAGDVFGNGMLLSNHVRLVAAFNHMHIFLDPTPDAATSFPERARLFNLPRSSWKDYNPSLISQGGGVYERSAKSILLSAEIKRALDIKADALSPDDLIKAILKAPVDLLWNGGIGTYVKAETESHEQVGDRTNNALRINGSELRCKVVGEGGNLGFTQRGRIEYALAGNNGQSGNGGGRINTDAIDNSAGVDCSDHEVNIKIALGTAVASGKLKTAERDVFLASMTDEVAALVLRDNFLQTQAITLAQLRGPGVLDPQSRFIAALEKQGLLDRAVEFLPSETALQERKTAKRGLTRPEIAVLLAYSKMTLYTDLLSSTLPDDPYYVSDLMRYFPAPMREQYAKEIETHPLRREIIATYVTNSMVNRAGITFFHGIATDTGMQAADVARAYTIARDAFGLRPLWTAIEQVGPEVSATAKVDMFVEVNRFVGRVTLWLLRNYPLPLDVATIVKEISPGIEEFRKNFAELVSAPVEKAFDKKKQRFTDAGVHESLAHQIALAEALISAVDVVKVAQGAKLPIAAVGKLYFTIGSDLRLGWLREMASRIPMQNYWERLALLAIVDDLYEQQRRLTVTAIASLGKDAGAPDAAEKWAAAHAEEMRRFTIFLDDLRANEIFDIPMLTVATRNVKSLAAM